jgi:hypothetical protein
LFFSRQSIEQSLKELDGVHVFFGICFLAFKVDRIPEGQATELNLTTCFENVLYSFYKPVATSRHWYVPFKSSTPSKRWKAERYASTTLQRIAADTFGDCLIHTKGTSLWGWSNDYLIKLQQHLANKPVPLRSLVTWLYRDRDLRPQTRWIDLKSDFLSTFNITRDEYIFFFSDGEDEEVIDGLVESPVDERALLELLGYPPDYEADDGAALEYINLKGVGPAKSLDYNPSTRLNVITGDNSLGKTFVFDCAWWALTGQWSCRVAQPTQQFGQSEPAITFSILGGKRPERLTVKYNFHSQTWEYPRKRSVLPGLVIYAQSDGSYAIWDPAVSQQTNNVPFKRQFLVLNRDEVWYGKVDRDDMGFRENVCNGLLEDWLIWQTQPYYQEQCRSLQAALRHLSPSQDETLLLGKPERVAGEKKPVPTLILPYGVVPLPYCSAGVRRISALAYMIVWAWHEHLENCRLRRQTPERRLVLFVDEVEAHLHPKWQRVIVPSLMAVLDSLEPFVSPQIHLATHSPLVLASCEPVFDSGQDQLHTLISEKDDVKLLSLEFVKRGRSDRWLTSPLFGLDQPRSLPAEEALRDAKYLQEQSKPDRSEVIAVNKRLLELLAQDDEFWPRWRFFAEQNDA